MVDGRVAGLSYIPDDARETWMGEWWPKWVEIITRILAVGCVGGAVADSAGLVAVELGFVAKFTAWEKQLTRQDHHASAARRTGFCCAHLGEEVEEGAAGLDHQAVMMDEMRARLVRGGYPTDAMGPRVTDPKKRTRQLGQCGMWRMWAAG
jgi:hypothetical protein